MSKARKRFQWWKRLTSRYRLVVMNDDTFEEETSFRLSRLNVYIWISTLLVVMFGIVWSLIVYTPLKSYVLGYEEVELKKNLIDLHLQVDSLQHNLRAKDRYLANLRDVMTGRVDTQEMAIDESGYAYYDSLDMYRKVPEDSVLRAEMERKDRFNLLMHTEKRTDKTSVSDLYFFPPLKGMISQAFKPEEAHFGIDIVAPENTVIKATLDGVVVFSGWTIDAGYVIALQHDYDLLSLYKHNAVLLKKTTNFVQAGDAIAIIGNTGEFTTGTHLHFELWYKGSTLDPDEYILFQ